MSPQEFERRLNTLTKRQSQFVRLYLAGHTEVDIARNPDIWVVEATVYFHLSNAESRLGLRQESRERCRSELVELFLEHRPDWVAQVVIDRMGLQRVKSVKPEMPGNVLSMDSDFYITPSCEQGCIDHIQRPGALIRIRSPKRGGKTSLLNRIVAAAHEQKYEAIVLNLRRVPPESLASAGKFLSWFYQAIARSLDLEVEITIENLDDCTEQFEEQVLENREQPLILAIDNVDVLFEYPEITKTFGAMLRLWFDSGKTPGADRLWGWLRLVVVHSTDNYIHLDRNKSPFENVGYVVRVSDATPRQRLFPMEASQALGLARTYGLVWSESDVMRLMQLVGGHPFLIQQALYSLQQEEVGLAEFFVEAPTLNGIYGHYLDRLLSEVESEPILADALRQVIAAKDAVQLPQEQRFKLEGLGLVVRSGNRTQMSCELYRQFFQANLQF
jgi:DNA-binding CsgD family transcriptional regulator